MNKRRRHELLLAPNPTVLCNGPRGQARHLRRCDGNLCGCRTLHAHHVSLTARQRVGLCTWKEAWSSRAVVRIAGLRCADASELVSSVWSAKLLFRVRACGIKLLWPQHFNRLGSNRHTLQPSTSKQQDIGCLLILSGTWTHPSFQQCVPTETYFLHEVTLSNTQM